MCEGKKYKLSRSFFSSIPEVNFVKGSESYRFLPPYDRMMCGEQKLVFDTQFWWSFSMLCCQDHFKFLMVGSAFNNF